MSGPSCSDCRHFHWRTDPWNPVGFCKSANVGPNGVPMVTCFTARHNGHPTWWQRAMLGRPDYCGPEGKYFAERPSPLPSSAVEAGR